MGKRHRTSEAEEAKSSKRQKTVADEELSTEKEIKKSRKKKHADQDQDPAEITKKDKKKSKKEKKDKKDKKDKKKSKKDKKEKKEKKKSKKDKKDKKDKKKKRSPSPEPVAPADASESDHSDEENSSESSDQSPSPQESNDRTSHAFHPPAEDDDAPDDLEAADAEADADEQEEDEEEAAFREQRRAELEEKKRNELFNVEREPSGITWEDFVGYNADQVMSYFGYNRLYNFYEEQIARYPWMTEQRERRTKIVLAHHLCCCKKKYSNLLKKAKRVTRRIPADRLKEFCRVNEITIPEGNDPALLAETAIDFCLRHNDQWFSILQEVQDSEEKLQPVPQARLEELAGNPIEPN